MRMLEPEAQRVTQAIQLEGEEQGVSPGLPESTPHALAALGPGWAQGMVEKVPL